MGSSDRRKTRSPQQASNLGVSSYIVQVVKQLGCHNEVVEEKTQKNYLEEK